MVFASVPDLEVRWRALSDSEKTKAEALLEDASAFLVTLLKKSGIKVDPDNQYQARNLKSVTCNIVHRSMATEDSLFGVTQFSQTAGSFTQSGTSSNPNGDMFLTAQEKNLLGISASGSRAAMYSIRGMIHKPDGSLRDDW